MVTMAILTTVSSLVSRRRFLQIEGPTKNIMQVLHKDCHCQGSVQVLLILIVNRLIQQISDYFCHWYDEVPTWQNWLNDLPDYHFRLQETSQLNFLQGTTFSWPRRPLSGRIRQYWTLATWNTHSSPNSSTGGRFKTSGRWRNLRPWSFRVFGPYRTSWSLSLQPRHDTGMDKRGISRYCCPVSIVVWQVLTSLLPSTLPQFRYWRLGYFEPFWRQLQLACCRGMPCKFRRIF